MNQLIQQFYPESIYDVYEQDSIINLAAESLLELGGGEFVKEKPHEQEEGSETNRLIQLYNQIIYDKMKTMDVFRLFLHTQSPDFKINYGEDCLVDFYFVTATKEQLENWMYKLPKPILTWKLYKYTNLPSLL